MLKTGRGNGSNFGWHAYCEFILPSQRFGLLAEKHEIMQGSMQKDVQDSSGGEATATKAQMRSQTHLLVEILLGSTRCYWHKDLFLKSQPLLMWVWVQTKPPGIGPLVSVHVSQLPGFHLGCLLLTATAIGFTSHPCQGAPSGACRADLQRKAMGRKAPARLRAGGWVAGWVGGWVGGWSECDKWTCD